MRRAPATSFSICDGSLLDGRSVESVDDLAVEPERSLRAQLVFLTVCVQFVQGEHPRSSMHVRALRGPYLQIES